VNSACASNSAANRSLEAGLVALQSSHGSRLVDHVPGSFEDALRPDLTPESSVEAAIVDLARPENSRYTHALLAHPCQAIKTPSETKWARCQRDFLCDHGRFVARASKGTARL